MTKAQDLSHDEFEGLAAIGLAHDFWRGQWTTVEEAHIHRPPQRIARIGDGEMFAANVNVTRIILEELKIGFDLGRIVDRLTAPGELRVGHWVGAEMQYRDVVDLLGPYYDEWAGAVHKAAKGTLARISKEGFGDTLGKYASLAAKVAPHWWGGPDWPRMAQGFLDVVDQPLPGLPAGLQDQEVVRRIMLENPDLLGTEALEWCVHHGLRERPVDARPSTQSKRTKRV